VEKELVEKLISYLPYYMDFDETKRIRLERHKRLDKSGSCISMFSLYPVRRSVMKVIKVEGQSILVAEHSFTDECE